MLTTKPQERKPMSDEQYRNYVIRLKANAKKAWKKSIFKMGMTIAQFEKTLTWVPFDVLKAHYKSQNA